MQASIGQMSGCLLNIVLDPFLILPFGAGLGAAGAGFATFLANCAACSYFLILLWREKGKTCVCLKPSFITLKKSILADIFTVGIPGVFQNILNVISMTILNNIVASYGADVVAAVGIANKINQLPIQIVFGFTQGVMPRIVETGAWFLSGFGISLPFLCIDFMVVGISQAFGMGKPALIFSFLRKLALEIPLILILNMAAGVKGIAYAQCLTEIAMAVCAIFVQVRLLRKKKEPVRCD